MASKTIISIVIPVYNRSFYIIDSINSIYAALQNISFKYEIIVVDDCSTDDTCSIVSNKFPGVSLYKQPYNMGAPIARNRGLYVCNGDFILFLDSDDIVSEDFFIDKIQVLISNESLDGIITPYARGDEKLLVISDKYKLFPDKDLVNSELLIANILSGIYVPIHTTVFRTSTIKSIRGFNEKITINQDVDLFFRLAISGSHFAVCDTGLAIIRDHDGERQGIIKNEEKLDNVLSIRRKFEMELRQKFIWNPEYSNRLAEFCFNYWIKYRDRYPVVAKKFLDYQKELQPNLTIKGRWPLRLIGYLFGADRAYLLRLHINRVLKI